MKNISTFIHECLLIIIIYILIIKPILWIIDKYKEGKQIFKTFLFLKKFLAGLPLCTFSVPCRTFRVERFVYRGQRTFECVQCEWKREDGSVSPTPIVSVLCQEFNDLPPIKWFMNHEQWFIDPLRYINTLPSPIDFQGGLFKVGGYDKTSTHFYCVIIIPRYLMRGQLNFATI